MKLQHLFRSLACILAAGLIPLAAASGADIVDQGDFFSAEALRSANETISRLEAKYGQPIQIETYASLPEDKAAAFARMNKAERDAFYASWIRAREKATQASGLFVLICKDPPHIHSHAGEGLVKHGFTGDARQRVIDAMLKGFREKKYDEGLTLALAQAEVELDRMPGIANAPGSTRPAAAPPRRVGTRPPESGLNFGGIVMIGLLIVGGLFLLRFLGRAMSGGLGGHGGIGMGGGGFGSGLFGGLLGALAGHWLYDSFAGHHGQAHADDYRSGHGGDDGVDGSDFGGGDFGGGDFGGGDFGGGDFGGGDFGGGDF